MSNNIDWGKIYCQMDLDGAFGTDTFWSTNAINDISSPTCWLTFPFTADTTLYTSDTTLLTADKTQF